MKKGFQGLFITDNSSAIEQLREDFQKDLKKQKRKLKKKEEQGKKQENALFQEISTLDAWNKWGAVAQNITTRLSQLTALADQTGPNAGKISIPFTYEESRPLLAELLNGYLGLSIDVYNGFAADRSLTLWTILASDLGIGGMGDNLFGSILFLQFMGNGLNSTPMLGGMTGIPPVTTLLIPRLLGAQIATL